MCNFLCQIVIIFMTGLNNTNGKLSINENELFCKRKHNFSCQMAALTKYIFIMHLNKKYQT